jgi:quinol---cytochrome c reductase iron-sulfur subunit, bacillus type
VSSHDDKPHTPASTIWPVGFAIGIACVLVGLVVNWWIALVGAAFVVLFAFLWVYDLTRGMRVPVAAPSAGAETVEVADEPASEDEELDDSHMYSRSGLLIAGTVGVGAAIGALVTLPVLGFAVLPAFESEKTNNVDLGPLENFPEGKYVVATFLQDPEQGEVSRKTVFVRNNGITRVTGKPQPSFTIVYSRCAHLGCPVQPGGLLNDADKKELKTQAGEPIQLIPVEGLSSFGCPCHGGQYDTEGRRTAGPPVRSLDRFAFSIVKGRLVLGTLFSVGEVEGSGGTAKIARYTSASPGVHVDGVERWLYPIPVPGR